MNSQVTQLQITGKIGKSGLGYVSAYLISAPNVDATIRFYVDTGASITTTGDRDAKRIGIDYTKLRKAPFQISGVGGPVDAYFPLTALLCFSRKSLYLQNPSITS